MRGLHGLRALIDPKPAACDTLAMDSLPRITRNPAVMGGKPCLRGMRVTVGTVTGMVAAGHSREEILQLYPYLEDEDITAALTYAAWRAEEYEMELHVGA